jgi:hypothetical protein
LFKNYQENVIKLYLEQVYKGRLNCQDLTEQRKNTTVLQQEELLQTEQKHESIQSVQQEQLQKQREVCNFWVFMGRLLGT